jgi:hypothetical protein
MGRRLADAVFIDTGGWTRTSGWLNLNQFISCREGAILELSFCKGNAIDNHLQLECAGPSRVCPRRFVFDQSSTP